MTAESVVGDSYGVPDTSMPPAASDGPGPSGGTAGSGESASYEDHAFSGGMPRSKLTAKSVQPGSKPSYVIPPAAGAVPGEADAERLVQNNNDDQDAAPNAGNGKEVQTSEGGEQTSSLAQQEQASSLAQAAVQQQESSESSEDEVAPAPSKTLPKKKPVVSKSVSKDKKKRKKSPWASRPSKNQYKLPLTQDQIYRKKLKDDMGPALSKMWKDTSAQKDRDDKNAGRPAYKYKTPKQLWATLEALKAKHAQNAPQNEEEGSDAEGQGQGSSSCNGAAKK